MPRNLSARHVVAALCSVVSIMTVLAVARHGHAADDPDFKIMMRRVLDAWQTMDPAKAAPFYTREANAVFFDIAPLKYVGWTAYAVGTAGVFAEFATLSMAMNEDVWVEKHGDVAITACTGHAEITRKADGGKDALEWRWTVVWEKSGKEWLISHEHLSAPLQMPEPAAPPAPSGGE